MAELFNIDISGIINNALSPLLFDLTITSIVDSAVVPSDPTEAPTRTETTHTGKGVITDFSDFHRLKTTIRDGDRQLLVIIDSLDPIVVIEPGFQATIEGVTYTIVGPVSTDPADATSIFQVRP